MDGLSLTDELQLLEKEYMVVAMTTIASLKHGKIPSSYIHQHILHLPQQTMKAKYRKLVATQGKGLDTASIEQLFLSFWPYCDFLNPDMLEYIVERFGDEISSDIVTMYVKRLREFRRKTVLKDMAGKWVGITPPGYVELSLQMDMAWESRTLEDLEVFRSYHSRMQWFFKKVGVLGSEVVFSVPKGVWLYQEDVYSLRKNRVLYVMEGERCVMELGVPLDETPQWLETSGRSLESSGRSLERYVSEDQLSQDWMDLHETTYLLNKEIQFGFHRKARENIFVSQNSYTAMIVDQTSGTGIAYTARPLQGMAEIELRLQEYMGGPRGSMKLGLMRRPLTCHTSSPSVPRLSEHRDNSCVWFKSRFKRRTEFQNNFGSVHLLRYYGSVNLCDLRQDDHFGLQVSVDGDLSFFVNGVSQGVAARQVYEEGTEVFCFVELVQGYGAVEITRAVMEDNYNDANTIDTDIQHDADMQRVPQDDADTEIVIQDDVDTQRVIQDDANTQRVIQDDADTEIVIQDDANIDINDDGNIDGPKIDQDGAKIVIQDDANTDTHFDSDVKVHTHAKQILNKHTNTCTQTFVDAMDSHSHRYYDL